MDFHLNRALRKVMKGKPLFCSYRDVFHVPWQKSDNEAYLQSWHMSLHSRKEWQIMKTRNDIMEAIRSDYRSFYARGTGLPKHPGAKKRQVCDIVFPKMLLSWHPTKKRVHARTDSEKLHFISLKHILLFSVTHRRYDRTNGCWCLCIIPCKINLMTFWLTACFVKYQAHDALLKSDRKKEQFSPCVYISVCAPKLNCTSDWALKNLITTAKAITNMMHTMTNASYSSSPSTVMQQTVSRISDS